MNSRPIDVSIIIVNWNTQALLAQCLRSIYDLGTDLSIEVVVVDNDSTDDSVEMVRRDFPQVHVIANTSNVGFARANNQAVALSNGRYALLLNSDAFLLPNTLEALVGLADEKPKAGVVGPQLRNMDGSFQASYTSFPNLWREFLILSKAGRLLVGRWYPSHGPEEDLGPQKVDYVEGACMLIRRNAYDGVGGLDENYFMYAEEVDLCYTMSIHGWQVWYQPAARAIHLGGGSSRDRASQREGDLYRSRVQFFRKHYGNVPAWLLRLQLYSLTTIKIVVHGLLRFISGGRYGRTVIPLSHLVTKLKGA